MTKDEAFGRLFEIKQFVENSSWFGEEDVEALDMAWEALYEADKEFDLDEAATKGLKIFLEKSKR